MSKLVMDLWKPMLFLPILGIVMGIAPQARAEYVSVGLSGWNQDVVAEKDAANPVAGTTRDISGWVWYETGAPDSSQGLPSNGTITSTYNTDVTFQLQAYNANNAVVVGIGESATLTLNTPSAFKSLAFLISSQAFNNNWYATLNFTDKTSSDLSSVTDNDWTVSSSYNARSNMGLVGRSDSWTGYYAGGLYMLEHDWALSTAQQKTIESITLHATTGSGSITCFALNGEPVPEPGTLALVATGLIGLLAYAWRKHK